MNFDNYYNDYRFAFGVAAVLHLIIFGMVFLSFIFTKTITPAVLSTEARVQPIQAVAVSQEKGNQEITKMRDAEKLKQSLENKRQRDLARQAQAAKAAKIKEQQAVEQLRIQRQKEHQQQLAEQKAAAAKLAQLKQQQRVEQLHLAKLAAARKAAEQKVAEQAQLITKQKAAAESAKQKTLNEKKWAAQKQRQLLQQQLAQQIDAEDKALSDEHAKQTNDVVTKYLTLIKTAIEDNWNKPETADPNAVCELSLQLAPDGTIITVNIAKSSGNAALDQSAITAAYKAQPFTVPTDPELFDHFRHFIIKTS